MYDIARAGGKKNERKNVLEANVTGNLQIGFANTIHWFIIREKSSTTKA